MNAYWTYGEAWPTLGRPASAAKRRCCRLFSQGDSGTVRAWSEGEVASTRGFRPSPHISVSDIDGGAGAAL